jgi:hypothetical protein
MSTTIYVLDTSYLLEIFRCGRDSREDASDEVRKRFKQANKSGGRFFVPLPCLFELGDHVADVKNEELRKKIAENLVSTVKASLETKRPWTITPTGNPNDILPNLLERFVPVATRQKIGLVDTFTWSEAERLKKKHDNIKPRVHIWTNDRALKSKEPDPEPDPFQWG